MKRIECVREFDVLEAVASGRWAAGAFPAIEAHLVECPICADLATVVAALAPDRDERRLETRVPPAAHVWWRAQVRARQEAAAAASRPITIAQGVAAASAIGLSCGAIAFWWDAISSPVRLRWDVFAEWVAAPATEWMLMALRTAGLTVPLAILTAGLVLMPVAFYIMFSEK